MGHKEGRQAVPGARVPWVCEPLRAISGPWCLEIAWASYLDLYLYPEGGMQPPAGRVTAAALALARCFHGNRPLLSGNPPGRSPPGGGGQTPTRVCVLEIGFQLRASFVNVIFYIFFP